jgi:Holliday junction resolvasome RuvABC endonuclease subunit
MSLIRVLGMDPSLSNWGLAGGLYDTDTGALHIKGLDLVTPVFPTGKQVRQNSKDLERAHQLAQGIKLAVQDAEAIFVEVPVGSQSARAMASYGICVGVLGALRANGTPFFEVTPTEVKLATVGKKTASKAQIIDRAMTQHPGDFWPMQTKKGQRTVIAGKAEHMADAIGAIEAGINTPQFQQTVSFIKAA